MKKFIVFIFSILSLSAFCQNKINISGLEVIDNYEREVKSRAVTPTDSICEVIVATDGSCKADSFDIYKAEIVEEISERLLIVSIPLSNIKEFASLNCVKAIQFGGTYSVQMDFARPASDVTSIQTGFSYNGGEMSFAGSNVVTGLMDVGIDPNHVNFKTAEGDNRVKQAYDYNNNKVATTARAIRTFTTDDTKETHGTHVAGIMAGGYNGNGDFSYCESPVGNYVALENGNIPYYGIATDSEIIMCGGRLTDSNILKGVKAIVDYAASVSKPAVVNLSLGSTQGPHDGTGLIEQGLSDMGVDNIICVAAGNDGDMPMFLGKTFSNEDLELKSFIKDNKFRGLDVWTNSSEPIEFSVGLSTGRRISVAATIDAANQTVNPTTSFTSSVDGTFTLKSQVDPINNRFHIQMSGSFSSVSTGQNVAITVKGKAGQKVYIYGNSSDNASTAFSSNNVVGYTDGTTDGTISSMACGSNVIAVGAYVSREVWPTFSRGLQYIPSYVLNGVSPFSSFGDSYQGTALPVICAPGAMIISSLNRYYTSQLTSEQIPSETTASVNSGALTNYWGPMQGTSMACPYVSGTVALWLEADPTLKVQDVIDILKKTAIEPTTDDPLKLKQWGAGKLDALAGIKEVLRRKGEAGIDGVIADAGGYVITPVGNRGYNVVVDGAAVVTARLYNLQGVAVATATGNDGEVTLDAGASGAGVYVLSVETPNAAPISRRVLLR